MNFYKIFGALLCVLLSFTLSAQVSGVIQDSDGPLVGVSVIEKGTDNGTITDLDGSFTLKPSSYPCTLIFSYVGYESQEMTIDKAQNVSVNMSSGVGLDEVVVVGSRGKPRTILTSAVPIDNINAADLRASGQRSVDQMINYKVPSYNSANQAISDATAHIDPSELRNLGPSRTLVLVNGKRKNQSAQVYLNDTPGRGEVGTDMKSIPAASIERIEVLRDGAAAQYGSDAVAGVVNIVLKERTGGSANVEAGITAEGDGLTYGADINYGFKLGKNGFLNLTGEYFHQDITDRAGEFADEVGDPLFEIPLGTDPDIDAYFNEHPDLGMTYGQPEITKLSGMLNFGTKYNEGKGELYGNWGLTRRDGKSFAFYRVWYWRPTDWGLINEDGDEYLGYQPTFETDITDITFTAGNKYNFNGWDTDLSFTYGGNTIDYTVDNSLNRTLEANSPTTFDPGGYAFENIVGNLDVSKGFGDVTLAFGTEFRNEFFTVTAGEQASYDPVPGTDSFPGLSPDNEVDESRNNIGVYASLDYDLSEATLLSGAVRFENYSDFGSNFSWKLAGRQMLGNNDGAIRASVSTGFRAPSLHQIYLSNIQTTAGDSGLIQEGTFSNVDPFTRDVLQIPQLDAETSFNITGGITYKLTNNISVSADYYNIRVNDRVLFSDQIGAAQFENTPLGDALSGSNVDAFKFFINAADTKTQGVDVILNIGDINIGANGNDIGFVVAANFNQTEIDGAITAPSTFGDVSIFGDVPSRLLTDARPNTKISAGINTNLGGFKAMLNNTYFGKVSSPVSGQEFAGKVITDLILSYGFTDNFGANLTVNNLFNIYPDRIDGTLDPFGYRLQYPWRVNQFGFNGMLVKAGLNFNF